MDSIMLAFIQNIQSSSHLPRRMTNMVHQIPFWIFGNPGKIPEMSCSNPSAPYLPR